MFFEILDLLEKMFVLNYIVTKIVQKLNFIIDGGTGNLSESRGSGLIYTLTHSK